LQRNTAKSFMFDQRAGRLMQASRKGFERK
jgi:hypothetical protein